MASAYTDWSVDGHPTKNPLLPFKLIDAADPAKYMEWVQRCAELQANRNVIKEIVVANIRYYNYKQIAKIMSDSNEVAEIDDILAQVWRSHSIGMIYLFVSQGDPHQNSGEMQAIYPAVYHFDT